MSILCFHIPQNCVANCLDPRTMWCFGPLPENFRACLGPKGGQARGADGKDPSPRCPLRLRVDSMPLPGHLLLSELIMYTYTYVYMSIYIYTKTHMCMYIYRYIHTCICVYVSKDYLQIYIYRQRERLSTYRHRFEVYMGRLLLHDSSSSMGP